MQFRNIAVLGTGLIGSSLALALRGLKDQPLIVGFDLNGGSRRGAGGLKTAAGQKAFDRTVGNLAEAVRGAELIILATPVRAMELLLGQLATLARPGAVVTDTASTKQQVLSWAQTLLPESVQFVGGHPMAGNVNAGPWEADGAIFENATYCLCPLARTARQAVEAVVKLVEQIGATAYFIDPDEHDGLVAAISHLPYLTAVAVVNAVAGGSSWREAATLAAGGFATASHLTESDPRMFTDICLTNGPAIVRQIDLVAEELSGLRRAILAGDESVLEVFLRAQERHREWISGRAAEGSESRPALDTASLRPQALFIPARLTGLMHGRGKEKER